MTVEDLMDYDYDLFFKDGEKLIHIASCGEVHPTFEKIDIDVNDAIREHILAMADTSGFDLKVSNDDVPDTSSFEGYSKKGIYSYDFFDGNLELMTEPTTPLSVSSLPQEIQSKLIQW